MTTPQDAEAVAQAREALVRVLQAAHISCEPSTFYDLAETLGVTFPPTEHQIADALFAAVRAEMAQEATDAIARLSAVPMRSLSPEEMGILMFANKAIAAIGHLAHNEQDNP